MRSQKLLGTSLISAVLSFGCGNNDSNVVVTVMGVPQQAVKLSVQATLGGKPAMKSVDFMPPIDRFGFTLASSMNGHLALNGSVFDGDGCTAGNGTTGTELPNPLVNITLPISAETPRSCGVLGQCAAETLCTYTPSPQTQNFRGIWLIAPNDVWAVGLSGTIAHYDGTGWTSKPSGVTTDLRAIWASGPNDIWVAGASALLLHYTGNNFAPVSVPGASTSNKFNGIWGLGTTDLWLVGDATGGGSPEFWHKDGSGNFTAVPKASFTGFLSGVWASSPSDVYAVGAGSTVLHNTGSSTTKSMLATITDDFLTVWGDNQGHVYVGGLGGLLFRSDSGGAFGPVTSPTIEDIEFISGTTTNIYAVCTGGDIMHSTGGAFKRVTSSTTSTLYGVQLGSDGIGWVAGSGGYLSHFDTRP